MEKSNNYTWEMKPKLVWEGLRRELVDPPYKKDLKSQVGKCKCTEQFVLTDMITTNSRSLLKRKRKITNCFLFKEHIKYKSGHNLYVNRVPRLSTENWLNEKTIFFPKLQMVINFKCVSLWLMLSTPVLS